MNETIEIIQAGEYKGEAPSTMEDECTVAEMLVVAAKEVDDEHHRD